MRHLLVVVLGTLGAGLTGVACGPSQLVLFQGTGGAAPEGSSSSSTTSSSSGVSAQASSSSGTSSGSSASSSVATSTSGTSSGTSASSSVATSASSSAATSASSTTSTSSGSPLPPILCDSGTCLEGQICCYNPTATGDHCGAPGTCEAGYVELTCSVPADCPGAVCCAEGALVNDQFIYSGISCKATCPITTPETQFPLCTEGSTTECGTATCVQSGELGTNYYVCSG